MEYVWSTYVCIYVFILISALRPDNHLPCLRRFALLDCLSSALIVNLFWLGAFIGHVLSTSDGNYQDHRCFADVAWSRAHAERNTLLESLTRTDSSFEVETCLRNELEFIFINIILILIRDKDSLLARTLAPRLALCWSRPLSLPKYATRGYWEVQMFLPETSFPLANQSFLFLNPFKSSRFSRWTPVLVMQQNGERCLPPKMLQKAKGSQPLLRVTTAT